MYTLSVELLIRFMTIDIGQTRKKKEIISRKGNITRLADTAASHE
jgi:hypothetical protein